MARRRTPTPKAKGTKSKRKRARGNERRRASSLAVAPTLTPDAIRDQLRELVRVALLWEVTPPDRPARPYLETFLKKFVEGAAGYLDDLPVGRVGATVVHVRDLRVLDLRDALRGALEKYREQKNREEAREALYSDVELILLGYRLHRTRKVIARCWANMASSKGPRRGDERVWDWPWDRLKYKDVVKAANGLIEQLLQVGTRKIDDTKQVVMEVLRKPNADGPALDDEALQQAYDRRDHEAVKYSLLLRTMGVSQWTVPSPVTLVLEAMGCPEDQMRRTIEALAKIAPDGVAAHLRAAEEVLKSMERDLVDEDGDGYRGR
ncbi:MAG TPA: hypothetical protein VGQ83_07980 [Polyangia bacterium]|jgi:hypothetical protein